MPCKQKRPYVERDIRARAGTKAYNHEYYLKVTKPKRRRRK